MSSELSRSATGPSCQTARPRSGRTVSADGDGCSPHPSSVAALTAAGAGRRGRQPGVEVRREVGEGGDELGVRSGLGEGAAGEQRRVALRRPPTAGSGPAPSRRSGRGPRATARSGRGPATEDRTLLTTTVGGGDGDDGDLLHGAHQPLEPHGVGRAHDDELVGRLERREGGGVAAGRDGVVAELLVVLDGEADVDDDVLGDPAGQAQDVLDRSGPQLGPAVGAREAGEDPHPRQHLGGQARERRDVEGALLARPGRRGDAGRLVDEAEHLGDRGAPGVEVDEQAAHPRAGEDGREGGGDRGAARRSGGSPDDGDGARAGCRSASVAAGGSAAVPERRLGPALHRTGRPRRGRSSSTRTRAASARADLGSGVIRDGAGSRRRAGAAGARPRRRRCATRPATRTPWPGEVADGVAVETAQVGRHDRHAGQPGRADREQLGEVGTAPDERDVGGAPRGPGRTRPRRGG